MPSDFFGGISYSMLPITFLKTSKYRRTILQKRGLI